MTGLWIILGIFIGKFLFPILEAMGGYVIAFYNLKYYKTNRQSSFENACAEVEAEQILSQKIQNYNDAPIGFRPQNE